MPRPSYRLLLVGILFSVSMFMCARSASPQMPPWAGSVVVLQDEQNQPFCSGFVIDKPSRFVITADHCVEAVGKEGTYIRGAKAREVAHIPVADIAVLQVEEGPILPPALAADLRPITNAGEKLYSAGFSSGPQMIALEVILPRIELGGVAGPWILFKPSIRSGMSGGPIVRWPKKGPVSVVGINQLGHPGGNLSLSRPLNELYPALAGFFELPPVGAPAPAQLPPGHPPVE